MKKIVCGIWRQKDIVNRIGSIVLYSVFAMAMFFVIINKQEWHVDEIYSYGLANNVGSIEMEFEQGVRYEPAELPYYNYLCAQTGQRLEYENVWNNQAADVHPPLYYMLLHTICSFFADRFLIWNAGIINVLFALLTLHYIRKMVMLFTEKRWVRDIASIVFCCLPGIWYTVAFLRMYCMAMFFVTWFSYLLISDSFGKTKRSYFLIAIATILGALTHYYCIVYVVFASAAYGIWKLCKKEYKDLLYYCVAMFLSGGISVLVFPSMIAHMFSGYRGEQSIDNLVDASLSVYMDRLKQYSVLVGEEILGGLLFFALLLGIVFLCGRRFMAGFKGKEKNESIESIYTKYVLLLVAIGAYFLLVSKMAIYVADRYMFPIYGVLFATMFSMLYHIAFKLLQDKWQYIVICVVGIIWIVGSVSKINPTQLFIVPAEILQEAKKHADVDSVYVYDARWKAMGAFVEVPEYKSVTFININNPEMIASLDVKEELIVLVTGEEKEKTIEQIASDYCNQMKYKEVGDHGYTKTYYLYRE